MKKLLILGLSSVISLSLGQEIASALDMSVTSATANVGETVDVELNVSSLGDGIAPSISAFDIDINYDNSILDFHSLVFGDQLDIFGLGSEQLWKEPSASVVNLAELSFDLPEEVNLFQAPNFTLATLTFDAVGVGNTTLTPSINALGDANADPLNVDNFNNGSVTVQQTTAAVPFEFSPTLGLLLVASGCGLNYWGSNLKIEAGMK